jgi:hypothetical protein
VEKVHWDVGTTEAFWSVVTTTGILRWPDVLASMMIHSSPFATWAGIALGAVLANLYLEHQAEDQFIATGGEDPAIHVDAMQHIAPLLIAALIWIVHGQWWALLCLVWVPITQLGRAWEHFRPEREAFLGVDLTPTRWEQAQKRMGDLAILVAFLALAITGFHEATNGRAWAPVLRCAVPTSGGGSDGQGTEQARLIQLSRDGTGAVGYRIDNRQVTEGHACSTINDSRVRGAMKGF